ncbi:hypothetical protein EDD98_3958 [Streptomyces sp. PanSC19]|uniref:hypothetical protein n=1 Tax=Streptomyces sp. PanSC19 TaxID=1520455 RepID=UPI000FA0E2E9|nr:hypothetical protein [Streptomyces sp. PanSC19]ROQ34905.1 hypothetical protein EDD98_3958 [Streptomyces sp. PanSC19]
MATQVSVARAQGWFNLVSGMWPLVHRRSFEGITGPKADVWLLQTVSGLLVAIGWAQIRGVGTGAGTAHARRLGIGTATALFVVDVRYATTGRIRRVYLLDAVFQALWLNAWFRGSPGGRRAGIFERGGSHGDARLCGGRP